jgi:S-adenosylmethionine:tRNA ribosyltransferase-isomerase
VIPARLFGKRKGIRAEPPGRNARIRGEFLQSQIEVLLVRQIEPSVWEALVRPGRKVRIGEHLVFGKNELEAEITGRGEYGLRTLRFNGPSDLFPSLESLGHIPLPPYISRDDDAEDRQRYQTIFAKTPGAVAAPTAGLHFTLEVLERIRARGIPVLEITLHVGLGTFQPLRKEEIEQNQIHCEAYEITAATAAGLEAGRREGRRILAVGTTVVRALEDAAAKGGVSESKATADIFIYPGYKFRMVDALLTNFHLPRTSLLAMVSAFAGREHILRAYRHAISAGYRFYSYGDCMLIR